MNVCVVLAKWAGPGTDDDKKKAAIAQLMAFERAYGGGVAQYTENAKKLLAVSTASATLTVSPGV